MTKGGVYVDTIVCHHQKGGDCWNKMLVTINLKEF